MKHEFLAIVAHELRNQLGPALTSLEVINRGSADAELCGRARAIMEGQLLRMQRLVEDLLDASRTSRGHLALRTERVDLSVVLEQAVGASRPAVEAAGHTLTLRTPPGPVYLEADPVRLSQVFGNLLINACKYTDPGGRIAVDLEQQGSDALVRVADNGIGIPPDLLARVFEQFMQVDRSPRRTEGGLGIGLALARQLVELHGGSIMARSEGLGLGSEFLVRLPVLATRLLAADSAPAAAQPPPAATCRILLVDDNRAAVDSLALLLGAAGYEAMAAYDGVQALEQAEFHRPEVILLDIGLPRLCGLDVCRAIRRQPWGKATVLIALTGWGQEDDRRRTAEAGFSGHLVKPFHPADLLALLARVGGSAPRARGRVTAARSVTP